MKLDSRVRENDKTGGANVGFGGLLRRKCWTGAVMTGRIRTSIGISIIIRIMKNIMFKKTQEGKNEKIYTRILER